MLKIFTATMLILVAIAFPPTLVVLGPVLLLWLIKTLDKRSATKAAQAELARLERLRGW